jgi:inosine-uridine nucleoside N-ribohydrolase
LTKVLEETDTPVDVLVLGPSTNIAELITQRPDLKPKIKQVIINGM